MFDFLSKFEGLWKIFRKNDSSGDIARERLRLVLIHDQASISPQLMETLKEEIIGVATRYLEIDEKKLEVGLEKKNGSIALAANIPIIRIRRTVASEERISSASLPKDRVVAGKRRRSARHRRRK